MHPTPDVLKDNEPISIGILGASYLQGETTRSLGRPVANFNILLHLLASKEVAKIYVFLQFGEQASAFIKLFDGCASAAKFVFVSVSSLPETSKKLHGFVCGDLYTHYANVIGLAPANMPVFTFTHSLDCDIATTEAAFFKMHRAKARIYDTIFATSMGAYRFLDNIQQSCGLQYRPNISYMGLPVHPRYYLESELEDHRPMFAKDDHWSFLYVGRVDFCTKADLRPLLWSSIFDNKTNTLTILGNFNSEAKAFFDTNHRAKELLARKQLVIIESQGDVALNNLHYSAAHFLISPANSYQETFGLSVAEARVKGCVPIVTRIQGYVDQVAGISKELTVPVRVEKPTLAWEQTMALMERREVNRVRSNGITFQTEDLNRAIAYGQHLWLERLEEFKLTRNVEVDRNLKWGDQLASIIRTMHRKAARLAQSNEDHNTNPLHSTMSGFNDF